MYGKRRGDKRSVGVKIESGKPGKPKSGSARRLMARCYHQVGEKREKVNGIRISQFQKKKEDPIRVDDPECMVSVKCEIISVLSSPEDTQGSGWSPPVTNKLFSSVYVLDEDNTMATLTEPSPTRGTYGQVECGVGESILLHPVHGICHGPSRACFLSFCVCHHHLT